MEYFGEAIVQFCWLDLKMKNKKGVGYVDIFKLRVSFFQLLIYFMDG